MDPIDKVAFRLHSNKGIYALLIGSGISKSAGIPTGWDVTKDLIEKIAVVNGSDKPENPVEWYKEKYKSNPSYSDLINELTSTPEERRNLLKAYFEPTDEEKEKGLKTPTDAHKSIAKLIRDGYVKVVITTNFDRLLENALQSFGVNPTIISTPDGISGAMPLTHSDITILKIHGDYLDTRIKNTQDELSNYDKSIDEYLDNILDEFGLIVCGWSGDWDVALRDAILRAPNRRFNSFWTHLGNPSTTFDELVNKRAGTKIKIEGADSFFTNLYEKVEAIELFNIESPNSISALEARVKKYLSNENYEISFHDLIQKELDKFLENFHQEFTDEKVNADLTASRLDERLNRYYNLSKRILTITKLSSYWGNQKYLEYILKIFNRLTYLEFEYSRSKVVWNELKYYPALLNYYIFGISAVAKSKYSFLNQLHGLDLKEPMSREKEKLVHKITVFSCFKNNELKILDRHKKNRTPNSEHLFQILRNDFNDILPIDKDYVDIFDEFEYINALNYYYLNAKSDYEYYDQWVPIGRFAYRRTYSHDFTLINDYKNALDEKGSDMEILKSGMFNGEKEELSEAISQVDDFLSKVRV